jgi:hypothetical protein
MTILSQRKEHSDQVQMRTAMDRSKFPASSFDVETQKVQAPQISTDQTKEALILIYGTGRFGVCHPTNIFATKQP